LIYYCKFFAILVCDAYWILAEITGDRRRQSAYEIRLMLWRVSWASAEICRLCLWRCVVYVGPLMDHSRGSCIEEQLTAVPNRKLLIRTCVCLSLLLPICT